MNELDTTISEDTLKAIAEIGNTVIPKKEKRPKKLPVYLSEEEYSKFIKLVRQPHHKIAFSLAYAAGLRISEVVKLEKTDIDLAGRRIKLREAKGNKERIVPLPKGFPESNLKYIPIKCAVRSLQIAFNNYAKKAGIMKPGLVFHSLRHSFAVRCMEKGIPLNVIQVLLGHENISTTSIYTRVNPADALKKYEELW